MPSKGVNVDKTLDTEVRDPSLEPYKRILPSRESRTALRERGLSWVLSSNVSGVGVEKKDLYVRFHNGSIYKYFNAGSSYEDMLKASSKGRWVWDNLRRRNVSYTKVGDMPLDEDVAIDDEEVMRIGITTKQLREVKDMATIHEQVLQEKMIKPLKDSFRERAEETKEKEPRTLGPDIEESQESLAKPDIKTKPEPYKEKSAGKTFDEWKKTISENEIDKDTSDIWSNLDKVFTKKDEFKNTKNAKVRTNWFGSELRSPKLTSKSGMDDRGVLTHETGHLVDAQAMRKVGYDYSKHRQYDRLPKQATNFHTTNIPEHEMNQDMLDMKKASKELNVALEKEMKKDITKENPSIIKDFSEKRKLRSKIYKDYALPKHENIKKQHRDGEIGYADYNKMFNKLKRESLKHVKQEFDDVHHPDMALSDMYDAMSNGNLFSGGKILSGHGRKYYRTQGNKEAELYAEYMQLKTHSPQTLEVFQKDYPEVYRNLENINKKIAEIMVK